MQGIQEEEEAGRQIKRLCVHCRALRWQLPAGGLTSVRAGADKRVTRTVE